MTIGRDVIPDIPVYFEPNSAAWQTCLVYLDFGPPTSTWPESRHIQQDLCPVTGLLQLTI